MASYAALLDLVGMDGHHAARLDGGLGFRI